MFTSHLSGRQRHRLRNQTSDQDEPGEDCDEESASKRARSATKAPSGWKQQRVPPIGAHHRGQDEPLLLLDDEEPDWRQAAQMLTERDEMRLLASSADTTDAAPVNRRRLQKEQQQRLRLAASHESSRPKSPAKRRDQHYAPTGNRRELDEDDISSISFAQSGCHSILSAWRLKSAFRASQRDKKRAEQQQQQQPQRPTSVLSNASSTGKRSGVSTAYTLASRLTAGGRKSPGGQLARIPLGPKSAQHFVTNSRRRRRANELILSTMEARRRALSLNRQSGLMLGGSLFGSESYLLAAGGADGAGEAHEQSPLTDYQRLSLSPSPLLAARTPSPGKQQQHRRLARSDLGGRQSPLVRSVQGNKMQNFLVPRSHSQSSLQQHQQPPLARLDQNSSDLCSSNESSSGDSSGSESSASSESRFTQLVTSELEPVERALMSPLGWPKEQRQPAAPAADPPTSPPKVPTRTRRRPQQEALRVVPAVRPRLHERQMVSSDDDDDDEEADKSSRLRRGALKRDSIRRLRMSRQTSKTSPSSSSSSSSAAAATAAPPNPPKVPMKPRQLSATSAESTAPTPPTRAQPLSSERKLDIESNPFLNRHHFRSLSQRSSMDGGAARPTEPESKSPEAQDRRQVERVERLLRHMAPNQTFRSRSQETTSEKSQAMETRTSPGGLASQRRQPESDRNQVPNRKREFESRTKLVRENLRPTSGGGGGGGYKQQAADRRLDGPAHDGGQISRLASISPPAEFSDQRDERAPGAGQLRAPVPPPRPPGVSGLSAVGAQKPAATNRAAPRASRERLQIGTSGPAAARPTHRSPPPVPSAAMASTYQQPASRRLASASAPASSSAASAAATTPTAPLASSSAASGQAAPQRLQPRKPAESAPQTSLPQFERTADAEFRKRVDQLRQLARANLAQSSREMAAAGRLAEKVANQQLESSRNLTAPQLLRSRSQLQRPTSLKPPSLNWKRPGESASASPPPPPLPTRYLSELSAPQRPLPPVASTNLDDMLLADRYQRPLGTWRRSNSSLASLAGDRRRATSPAPPASLLSQSALSEGPREPGAGELVPMRLVVKERSAPRRDFAFVEQRAPLQRLQQVDEAGDTAAAGRARSPPAPMTTPVSSQNRHTALAALQRRARLASVSPRSPELASAHTANSSSNDDSAIASSVSSPSLSFSPAATSAPESKAPDGSAPASQRVPPVRQLTGLRMAAPAGDQLAISVQPSGALQSILRRQQQMANEQHLKQQQLGSTSASNQQERRPTNAEAAGQPHLVPISTVSHAQTSQTTLNQTTSSLLTHELRRPSSEASAGSKPDEIEQQVEQQQQRAPLLAAQKRVHFNDRTSIRSFESLSSENSNLTEINKAEQQRQLVGSPDSMGSGSTSRLSCESPDFRRTSGAAIYAVRGDPELEQVGPAGQQQRQLPKVHGSSSSLATTMRQQTAAPMISPTRQQATIQFQQQQQTVPMQLQQPQRQPPHHPVAISIAQQQFNQRQQQMQSPQLGSPTGCIRMTAPPMINTSLSLPRLHSVVSPVYGQPGALVSAHLRAPQPQSQPQQQLSATPSLLMQQQSIRRPVAYGNQQDDEEDPDYTFRLRQAAANRAFSFGQQQQQQPLHPTARPQAAPANPADPGAARQAQRARQARSLANFQTEV